MRLEANLFLQALGLLIAGLISLSPPVYAEEAMQGAELVTALKHGGYVIYLRHAATDRGMADRNREELSDWTKQRNLSETGRQQAIDIGKAVQELGIPVSKVISSPYCRCVETAKLAFGEAEVTKDLAFSIGTQEHEANRLGVSLRKMLGAKPAAGTNTVLVAHTANLKEAAKIWPKPEGVAYVFKPMGDGKFEKVGKLEPQQWPQLAKELGTSSKLPRTSQQIAERHVLCGTKDARADSK